MHANQDLPELRLSEADKIFIWQKNIEVAREIVAVINNGLVHRFRSLEDQMSDLRQILIGERAPANNVVLKTDHPVAYTSNDHIQPWGTKNDNTRSARFCRAIEQHFKRPVSALDLGCSGGGLIFDFLVRGHLAIGLEGSDFSLNTQRAEWRVIADYLQTCDITKPFELLDKPSNQKHQFDVVTMWEVLEHIREADLPQLFMNIKSHLASDGLFVGSIALYDDIVDGVSYHPTVKPAEWWQAAFEASGLTFMAPDMFRFGDFCRGTGNGPLDPDFSKSPDKGFHFVASHVPGTSGGRVKKRKTQHANTAIPST